MPRAKQSQESSQERWSVGSGESHELTRFKMRAQDVFAGGVREIVHLANCRPSPLRYDESTARVTCDKP